MVVHMSRVDVQRAVDALTATGSSELESEIKQIYFHVLRRCVESRNQPDSGILKNSCSSHPIEFRSLDLIDETISSGFCELFLRL